MSGRQNHGIFMFLGSLNPNPGSVWPDQVWIKVRSRSNLQNPSLTK